MPATALRSQAPARTGVVLLNFGAPDDTLACLASLERSADLDMEIVVVDNGPDDLAHQQLVAAVGRRAVVLAAGDNLGYSGGNNVGLRHLLSRGCAYVWILNPDTEVEPDTLPLLIAHLESYADCGVVGPRVLFPNGRIWSDGGIVDLDNFGATHHRSVGRLASSVSANEPFDVDYVPGASVLVRRKALLSVGLLPEEWFLYFEETDWCRRASLAGWRVMIEPRASMVHHKRSGLRVPTPYYLYYMTRNRYRFVGEVLGLDAEAAWEEMEVSFHARLRGNVEQDSPGWLDRFDELVDRAKADARAGRYGRNDDIAAFPAADTEGEPAC